MTEKRSTTDRILDAGASFDWITPAYEALRNITVNGKNFTMREDDWRALKPKLKKKRIKFWGEALHWRNGAHWITFSVRSKQAGIVTALSGYRPTGGRGRAWLMIAILIGGLTLTIWALTATLIGVH